MLNSYKEHQRDRNKNFLFFPVSHKKVYRNDCQNRNKQKKVLDPLFKIPHSNLSPFRDRRISLILLSWEAIPAKWIYSLILTNLYNICQHLLYHFYIHFTFCGRRHRQKRGGDAKKHAHPIFYFFFTVRGSGPLAVR